MKNISCLIILSLMISEISYSQDKVKDFKWPDNKKAAVCLTFDDGQDSHLDKAVPLLDSYNMKGSFYCNGNSSSLQNRTSEWRKIAESGHELGNHSLFHPCDGQIHEWVKPEYDLRYYSLERIKSELYTANTLLKAIDGNTKRTYAYTCSNYKVEGDTSYIFIVKDLFTAARNDGPIPEQMSEVDVHFMPSWCVDSEDGKELIAYVKEAKKNGTIATFMFHSVDGDYLNVSSQALKELLTFLKDNEQDYWVDTFYNVTEYISLNKNQE